MDIQRTGESLSVPVTDVTFKTIHECRLELVAHAVLSAPYFAAVHALDMGSTTDADPSAHMLPVSAARASFGNEDKTGDNPAADVKLMRYLADHGHLTPFEYNHATFLIECPLLIRSQIHRHRTFSYNEISRRYTSEDLAFWLPDKWRAQSASNKQASAGEVEADIADTMFTAYKLKCQEDLGFYYDLLAAEVCREQARAALPQALITRFYMGGNLRNWAHFIKLRKDAHAQYEVRVVAERIENELRKLWPAAVGALLPLEGN